MKNVLNDLILFQANLTHGIFILNVDKTHEGDNHYYWIYLKKGLKNV